MPPKKGIQPSINSSRANRKPSLVTRRSLKRPGTGNAGVGGGGVFPRKSLKQKIASGPRGSRTSSGGRKKRISRKSLKTGNAGGVEEPVGGRRGSSRISLSRKRSGKISEEETLSVGSSHRRIRKRSHNSGNQDEEGLSIGEPSTTLIHARKKRGTYDAGRVRSGGKIHGKSNESIGTLKAVKRTQTLENLEVTKHLFNLGLGDDMENQRVWSCRTAVCNKKTLTILAVLLILVAVTVTVVILATSPQTGSNNTSTSTTAVTSTIPNISMTQPSITGQPSTPTTSPSTTTMTPCPPVPPNPNLKDVEAYCLCKANDRFDCQTCCTSYGLSPPNVFLCQISCTAHFG